MVDGARLVAFGVAAGLLLALAAARLFAAVAGVGRLDVTLFGGASAVVAAAALLACDLPARRATRVDPLTILRDA